MENMETIDTTQDNSISLFVRQAIAQLQERMIATPGAMLGDCCPLKHTFAHGLYIREITMPAGILIVTKLHKYSHAAFILQGDVSIMEETGPRRVSAPASFITPAGTKRVVFTHSETIWITVHATDKTDIKEIEEEIIAKSFEDMENNMEVVS
jgi:hypothetical protein